MSSEVDRIKKMYTARVEQGVIENYSLFLPGELYMLQRREEECLRLLYKNGTTNLSCVKILEVGCGRGMRLADWSRWGAEPCNLYGIDLMEPFIREAEKLLPLAHLAVGSIDRLPYADESFDLVVQLTVFTSIIDADVKRKAAAEMARVLRANGIIIWYDFRYPSLTNHSVKNIGLKELRNLFPGCSVDVRSITLLPPLVRRLALYSWTACRVMEACFPSMRSHYLALIKKSKSFGRYS